MLLLDVTHSLRQRRRRGRLRGGDPICYPRVRHGGTRYDYLTIITIVFVVVVFIIIFIIIIIAVISLILMLETKCNKGQTPMRDQFGLNEMHGDSFSVSDNNSVRSSFEKVCAVLCCAVLCCAVLCCAVLCCTVLVSYSNSNSRFNFCFALTPLPPLYFTSLHPVI